MTQYLGILILGALSIGGVIGLWLWAAEQDRLRAQHGPQPRYPADTHPSRQALRAALADPFAGMTEQELDRIARGQPLPEGTCHNRDICESYARENRDGLLLEALVNDSRVLACLARGEISQLSIEWARVAEQVTDAIAEAMR